MRIDLTASIEVTDDDGISEGLTAYDAHRAVAEQAGRELGESLDSVDRLTFRTLHAAGHVGAYPTLRFGADDDGTMVTLALSRLSDYVVKVTCADGTEMTGAISSCRSVSDKPTPVLIIELDDGTVWQRNVADILSIEVA